MQQRAKTKIVATMGPASDSEKMMRALMEAGVSVFRFNMKHGDVAWHQERMRRVRQVAKQLDLPVAILMDLQGPEIRVGKLPGGKLKLKEGDGVWFGQIGSEVGRDRLPVIPIDQVEVVKSLKPGNRVLIDDGFLAFEVVGVKGKLVQAVVRTGGELGERKGVNVPELVLDIPALVERDLENLTLANKEDVDWIALSFVRSKKDVELLRQELRKLGLSAGIIAKIERQQALDNFEEILESSDGVMVARGDLGVETPIHEVPFWQKQIIRRCREVGKPVITATQMLQSMVEQPLPTRAEISDVANAIYDRTDAVMLSAETASGKYPVKAVATMALEAEFTEAQFKTEEVGLKFDQGGQTGALVMAAAALAKLEFEDEGRIKALVVLTESGFTARFLARLRPNLPIIAVAKSRKLRDQLCLVWGVRPVYFEFGQESEKSMKAVWRLLKARGEVKRGDKVIMVYGDPWGKPGKTSVMRVEVVT